MSAPVDELGHELVELCGPQHRRRDRAQREGAPALPWRRCTRSLNRSVEAAASAAFAAINRYRPDGVRYASRRLGDSETFVIMRQVDDVTDDPRAAGHEFRAFPCHLLDAFADPPDGLSTDRRLRHQLQALDPPIAALTADELAVRLLDQDLEG